MPIKKYMIQNSGINLHFSSQNLGQVAAYKHICKDKFADVLLNPVHVNLDAIGLLRTKKCMKAFEANNKVRSESLKHSKIPCSSKSKSTDSKVKCLSNIEEVISEFMLEKHITDDWQLLTRSVMS